MQSAGKQTHSQEASDLCTAAQPLEVLRCTKRPVSPPSVISAKPADKWAVNRVKSGHMYGPVFNYLAVNPAKRSPSLYDTAAHPCIPASVSLCLPHSGLSPLAFNCCPCIFNISHNYEHLGWSIMLQTFPQKLYCIFTLLQVCNLHTHL